jgi:hypothetical protein
VQHSMAAAALAAGTLLNARRRTESTKATTQRGLRSICQIDLSYLQRHPPYEEGAQEDGCSYLQRQPRDAAARHGGSPMVFGRVARG